MKKIFCEVIVDIAHSNIDRVFDYLMPESMNAGIGYRVLVPFGNKNIEGIILRFKDSTEVPEERLKEVSSVLDDMPIVTEDQIELAGYLCVKYRTTMAFALRLMFPAKIRGNRIGEKAEKVLVLISEEALQTEIASCYTKDGRIKAEKKLGILRTLSSQKKIRYSEAGGALASRLQEKGIVSIEEETVYRRPQIQLDSSVSEFTYTSEQQKAIDTIDRAIDGHENRTFLLHGITGSGKTEVYIAAVRHALETGKTAICLVPEISITPQILNEFSKHFGDIIAVFHSALSDGEKYDEWKRIRNGEAKIVLGARSAIFMPLEDIGVIIIDEEHSESYKSDNHPRYNAIEVANIRSKMHHIPLVLASATPLVEDYLKVKLGQYELIEMKHRVLDLPLPPIEVVDMKKEFRNGNRGVLSGRLIKELGEVLSRGEQAMLFLNRRGYASSLICTECGEVVKCSHCDIPLKYHKDRNVLLCHYCGRTFGLPDTCPNCGSRQLRLVGTGTEKVVEELEKYFPEANILRMDFDTTRKKDSYTNIFRQFREGKADFLVGTQMIARGLDFPNVTLSAIISVDSMLYSGDFRQEERTYSMIEQVGGRAGRKKAGRVIVQTFSPEHYAVRCAEKHDFEGFFEKEIEYRRQTFKPPYTRVYSMLFVHQNEEKAEKLCEKASLMLKNKLKAYENDILLFVSKDAPIRKLDGKSRFHILIKAKVNKDLKYIKDIIYDVWEEVRQQDGVLVGVDIDPYSVN